MVANRVLGLEAKAVADGQGGTPLPIILDIESGIDHVGGHGRNRERGGSRHYVDGVLKGLGRRGRRALKRSQVLKQPCAVEAIRRAAHIVGCAEPAAELQQMVSQDRKSTRLNSSHSQNSYAV